MWSKLKIEDGTSLLELHTLNQNQTWNTKTGIETGTKVKIWFLKPALEDNPEYKVEMKVTKS